ncbi:restriction endonuclease subunit S [Helicobacter suis]|uniref:restriction endonuclease subunit S n=1 Tax=Helicobacter suis TaxID=104628 RepID=UPI003D30FF8C
MSRGILVLFIILLATIHNVSSFAAVDIQRLQRYAFPLPPLFIQERIVTILDCLTELTARKKQFHYYLDALLDFEGARVQNTGQKRKVSTKELTSLQKSQDTDIQVALLKTA